MRILILGGGGFIGGFMAKNKIENGHEVTVVDIKEKEEWYQVHEASKNVVQDASIFKKMDKIFKMGKFDEVYNFACNMGGIGYCELNQLDTGMSIEINTTVAKLARKYKPKKLFYSSSACVYNETKQNSPDVVALKESDAWPAQPDLLYGLEKLFSERIYFYLGKECGVDVRIARFHNVYGPLGTYEGGREKAPAAAIRKIIEAKKSGNSVVNMWGDGLQTRSFMYIDDCVEGVNRLMESDFKEPINLGSDELISIKGLHDLAAEIAEIKVEYKHDLSAPQGVRGRNSDNSLIKKVLGWAPSIKLDEGMRKTYTWINEQMSK